MEYLVSGILIIVFTTAIIYFAWRKYQSGNVRSSLLLILLVAIVLRVFAAADAELHTWDEQYHALVAKNLSKHPLTPTLYDNPILPYTYTNWIGNHIWLEKGPVPLWTMAASISVFGTNILAVRLPSIIISTLAVFITFLIGSSLFDKKTGLLATFFHAVNGLAIELAAGRISSDHVETAFVFYTECAILFAIFSIIKKRSYLFAVLTGICVGLAVLSKWAPALLVFPAWFAAAILSKKFSFLQIFKHAVLMGLCSMLIFMPWIVYILEAFPQEANFVLKKFIFAYSDTVEGHSAPAWYYIHQIGVLFGEIIYLPVLISLYFLFKRKAGWQLWLLSLWWIIPVLVFSSADTKRHTYMLICAPAFFLLGAYFWFYLKNYKPNVKYPFAITLALILLVALPVRYGLERIKPFKNREEQVWSKEIKTLHKIIPEKKAVVFNVEHYAPAMFYSNFIVYPNPPKPVDIEKVNKAGYTVYINADDSLKKVFTDANVKFIRLEQAN